MTRKRPTQRGVKMKKPVARPTTTNVENIFGAKLLMINSFLILPSVYHRIVNFWLGKKEKNKIVQ
jgi:hypothetical protein